MTPSFPHTHSEKSQTVSGVMLGCYLYYTKQLAAKFLINEPIWEAEQTRHVYCCAEVQADLYWSRRFFYLFVTSLGPTLPLASRHVDLSQQKDGDNHVFAVVLLGNLGTQVSKIIVHVLSKWSKIVFFPLDRTEKSEMSFSVSVI